MIEAHGPAFRFRFPSMAFVAVLAIQASTPAAGQASRDDYDLIKRLGAAMERCWFSGDAAFADYGYSPEPNATGGARILIVTRATPQERPALVIEVTAARGINAYGPLGDSPLAGRVGADLRRWLGGNYGCG